MKSYKNFTGVYSANKSNFVQTRHSFKKNKNGKVMMDPFSSLQLDVNFLRGRDMGLFFRRTPDAIKDQYLVSINFFWKMEEYW